MLPPKVQAFVYFNVPPIGSKSSFVFIISGESYNGGLTPYSGLPLKGSTLKQIENWPKKLYTCTKYFIKGQK